MDGTSNLIERDGGASKVIHESTQVFGEEDNGIAKAVEEVVYSHSEPWRQVPRNGL